MSWAWRVRVRQWRRRWRARRQHARERQTREAAARMPDGYVPSRRQSGLLVLVCSLGLLYAVWLLSALVFTFLPQLGKEPPIRVCPAGPGQFYCGQVIGYLNTLLGLAFAAAIFLIIRYRTIIKRYRSKAREEPEQVARTAAQDPGRVVGREELCALLLRRLQDRESRRPLILVGGVGAGKTATLKRLTEDLAEKRFVPIGLDLRRRKVDNEQDLDFLALARSEFQRFVDPWLHSAGDGDKVWRWLRRQDRIAVLADGLEQVDVGSDADRDSVLRFAIGRAAEQHLPLVIASRPNDPLRGMDASVLQLEPLSEGAALDYVLGGERVPGPEWARVAGLVKVADIAESPVHLRIIGDLYECRQLDTVAAERGDQELRDRSMARWHLMEGWRQALVSGRIRQDYGIPENERRDAIEVLSALACLGLRDSRADVNPNDLLGLENQPLVEALKRKLVRFNPCLESDLGLAQNIGVLLRLVERLPKGGLRFPHGAVQAYLGARFLEHITVDWDDFLRRVQASRGPSRELLAAMTLFSRSTGPPPQPTLARRVLSNLRPRAHTHHSHQHRSVAALSADLADWLCDIADRDSRSREEGPGRVRLPTGDRTRAVEMFAAALEIDSWLAEPAHRGIAAALARAWPTFQQDHSITDRPLGDAKLALVRRFGAATRLLVGRGIGQPRGHLAPDYLALFGMMCVETSYPVRLVAVREMAAAGGGAAQQLKDRLQGPLYTPDRPRPDESHEEQLRDWLVPLLYLYSHRHLPPGQVNDPRDWLRSLLRSAVDRCGSPGANDLIHEMHLAQGFRLAANCRILDDGGDRRQELIEEAERMLGRAHLWYAHLVLLQALTLLSLPDDPRNLLPHDRPASDPRGLVDYWLSIAGGGRNAPDRHTPPHPLVQEAADLCVEALRSGQPERYCWIDELDTVSRVGSCNPRPEIRGEQESWLPQSVGWGVLEPRAQRLLADLMLLLNLADRCAFEPPDRNRLLARSNRPELPPCLTVDRAPLRAGREHPSGESKPGATCMADCSFRLCPLPAPNEDLPHQVDEAFCARQIDLTSWRPGRSSRASWQLVPRSELRTFWRQMSTRMLPRWRK